MIQKQPITEDSLTKLFNQTKLTIIAGAEKHAKPFADYLAKRYDYCVDTISVTDTKIIFPDFTNSPDADVAYNMFFFTLNCEPNADINTCARVVQSLSTFGEETMPVVVIFPCAANGRWRSLYFHIDDDVKEKTQLLLLNVRDDTHVDLTVERGDHTGEYIPFHFDPTNCLFTKLIV